jgi:DNA primase
VRDLKALKARIDLVELLTHYGLTLKRRGKNLFTLCPFHQDSSPSLSVNPQAQLYHCFGCGAGGDAFTFVQRHDHLTFNQAVRKLIHWTSTTTAGRA